MGKPKTTIVLYDGECGFCNHSVQFILNNRRHNHFQFTALQNKLAKEILQPFNVDINMETLYVVKNNHVFEKSSAILTLTNDLKPKFQLLKAGFILPRFIRDGLYNIISRNRHKIKAGYCAVPTEEEKSLFKN